MSKAAEVLAQLREEQTRLELELAQLERVIEALEEAIGVAGRREDEAGVAGGRDAAAATNADTAAAPAPPAAPYAQLDLYEATAAYLAACGEPQTARQIAEGLRAGGFKTRSQDFAGTVRTMLRRQSTPGIRVTSDGSRWYARAKP